MSFMAEWIYKEQNPDYLKIASGEKPLTYSKLPNAETPARSFSMSAHDSANISRQQTYTEQTPRQPTVRFDSQVEVNEDAYQKPDVTSDDDDQEDEDEVGNLDEYLEKKKSEPANAGNAGRSSVSAEVFGTFNKKGIFKANFIPKSPATRKQIKEKLNESFLFKTLDEKDLETCIDAMDIRTYNKGESIIRQGEEGNDLFVVESGTQKCVKTFKGNPVAQLLLTYSSGMAFGE